MIQLKILLITLMAQLTGITAVHHFFEEKFVAITAYLLIGVAVASVVFPFSCIFTLFVRLPLKHHKWAMLGLFLVSLGCGGVSCYLGLSMFFIYLLKIESFYIFIFLFFFPFSVYDNFMLILFSEVQLLCTEYILGGWAVAMGADIFVFQPIRVIYSVLLSAKKS